MRLLLIGPPGCGKGTRGARIAEQYGVEHIAAGDILRAEVTSGTTLGTQIADYTNAGELVPDNVILDVVMPRVLAAAESTGYVLDGFPRSMGQAVEARRIAEQHDSTLRLAVYLQAPDDVLVNDCFNAPRFKVGAMTRSR
jgi:adenylate kinase